MVSSHCVTADVQEIEVMLSLSRQLRPAREHAHGEGLSGLPWSDPALRGRRTFSPVDVSSSALSRRTEEPIPADDVRDPRGEKHRAHDRDNDAIGARLLAVDEDIDGEGVWAVRAGRGPSTYRSAASALSRSPRHTCPRMTP